MSADLSKPYEACNPKYISLKTTPEVHNHCGSIESIYVGMRSAAPHTR